jgi:hypothetical protein
MGTAKGGFLIVREIETRALRAVVRKPHQTQPTFPMSDNVIQLGCWQDLSNFLSRSQNHLDTEFGLIEGLNGTWQGKIKSGGVFPQSTGFAARHTVLGFQRARETQIKFTPMAGHQDDCVASCNSQPIPRKIQSVDHRWYRVMNHSEYTEPFCLKTMWQEAFELKQQIANIFENLKQVTMTINDEFSRSNQVFYSDNHWLAIDNGTNTPVIQNSVSTPIVAGATWRFAQDVNGNYDTNKVILGPNILPQNIGYLTVDVLNRVRQWGIYRNAFDKTKPITVITDWDTADYIPKIDSNQRLDNRHRDPESLDPAFNAIKSYSSYDFEEDPLIMRYNWDLNDPNYPNGVFTRVEAWAGTPASEGCIDDVSADFLNADFQISIPFNNKQWKYQTMSYPTSLPGQSFEQPFAPYNGMWTWQNNKTDQITPCNLEQNMGYWYMVWEMAAMPDRPQLGHAVFHRRFNTRGVIKSCRPLTVSMAGSYASCFNPCPPYNFWPPALVTRQTCGRWNNTGTCTLP